MGLGPVQVGSVAAGFPSGDPDRRRRHGQIEGCFEGCLGDGLGGLPQLKGAMARWMMRLVGAQQER